jgi:predicted PurR-regulated permease PerM
MLGPVFAIFPAVIFALFNSVQTAIGVLIFYTVLQQLDGNILTPLVMHKVTGINTIVIIFSVLIGVSFAGFLGALIAVPVTSVISIFLSDLTYTTKPSGVN